MTNRARNKVVRRKIVTITLSDEALAVAERMAEELGLRFSPAIEMALRVWGYQNPSLKLPQHRIFEYPLDEAEQQEGEA